jgi:hypothetical protein
MSTDALAQRIARMSDAELVRTLFLFEHVEAIDVSMRDMMAVVWPDVTLPAPDTQGTDIMALLRAELKRRVLAKGRQP